MVFKLVRVCLNPVMEATGQEYNVELTRRYCAERNSGHAEHLFSQIPLDFIRSTTNPL